MKKNKNIFILLLTFILALAMSTSVFSATIIKAKNKSFVINTTKKLSQIKIQQDNNSITVNWKSEPGAVGYQVYMIKGNTSTGAAEDLSNYTVKTNSFVVKKNLQENKFYKFYVIAKDKSGKHLAYASTAIIKITNSPINTIKTPSNGKVYLKWRKSALADRYKIQYVKGSNFNVSGVKTILVPKNKIETTISGLADNTSYSFRLYAEKTGFISTNKSKISSVSASSTKSIKTKAKTTTKQSYYKATFTTWGNKDAGISLAWKKVNNAKGYQLFRKEGSGNWKPLAHTDKNTILTYTDKTAKVGKLYYYAVVGHAGKANISYKNGMSDQKALVRLTKAERGTYSKSGNALTIRFGGNRLSQSVSSLISRNYKFKGSQANETASLNAADTMLVEWLDKNAKTVKKETIKKNNKSFNIKISNPSYKYVRVRYGKTINKTVYGGVWSDKIILTAAKEISQPSAQTSLPSSIPSVTQPSVSGFNGGYSGYSGGYSNYTGGTAGNAGGNSGGNTPGTTSKPSNTAGATSRPTYQTAGDAYYSTSNGFNGVPIYDIYNRNPRKNNQGNAAGTASKPSNTAGATSRPTYQTAGDTYYSTSNGFNGVPVYDIYNRNPRK